MSDSAASDGTTARLARFVAQTSYDDLPPDVVEAVKFVVLDTIGVTAAGASTPTARKITSLAQAYGGSAVSSIIGRDVKCDPAWAAIVNGVAGHQMDYDDQSWSIGGHPSVVLLPAILALAEARGLSGRDVIRAYALGFECASVVGRAVNPDHYGHGWHTTGTVGAVGSTCASAALLGLDVSQIVNAIALGASSAAGLRQNFGTDGKSFHAGNASRSGVIAAELAARGFGGDPEILEGRWGFFNVFSPAPLRDRPSQGGRLGQEWDLLLPGVATKVFPSCGATHPAIGAILELRDKGLRAQDVKRIDVRVVDMTARILDHHRPKTGLEAKFSMEYCIARALVSGSVVLDHFLDRNVVQPDVTSIVERTVMTVDPVLTAEWVWGTPRATELAVERNDGEILRNRADLPPGSPGNFDRDMLNAKFDDCLRRNPLVGSPGEIATIVDHLDKVEVIGDLMAMLLEKA